MIKIAVLALPRCHASGIHGVMDFFATANFCAQVPGEKQEALFDCQIITADNQPVQGYSGALVTPTVDYDAFAPDVMVVGSGVEAISSPHRVDQYLEQTRPVHGWLWAVLERGGLLASVCTGSLVLAEAGVLQGQVATTHWRAAMTFRQRYPDVRLEVDQLLVDNGQVICAGGATAFVDLCLYLVERLASAAVALACSKLLVLDHRRVEQTPYMSLYGHRAHPDDSVHKAQDWLEQHFAEPVTIDEVAAVAGLGDRTFKRRFKEATGENPLAYLQQLRVEAAKHLLESSREQTSQIIWKVGYEDASSFRRLFKRTVGCTMEQYRKRFSYVAPPEPRRQALTAGV